MSAAHLYLYFCHTCVGIRCRICIFDCNSDSPLLSLLLTVQHHGRHEESHDEGCRRTGNEDGSIESKGHEGHESDEEGNDEGKGHKGQIHTNDCQREPMAQRTVGKNCGSIEERSESQVAAHGKRELVFARQAERYT